MRRVMLNSVGFILGFSVVFIALGAAATEVGQVLGNLQTHAWPVWRASSLFSSDCI